MLTKDQSERILKISLMIKKVLRKKDLSRGECRKFMEYILNGYGYKTNQSSLGAFLAGLYMKGVKVEEVIGLLEAIGTFKKFKELKIKNKRVVSAVGSGKDEFKTFNITTVASFIAAGSGIPVAKVGCSAETSTVGTIDVLKELGINTNASFSVMFRSLRDNCFGFFNPKLRLNNLFKHYIGKVNFFNPLEYGLGIYTGIRVEHILFGISDLNTEISAKLLRYHGFKHSLVVCGLSNKGLLFDELSTLNKSKVSEVKNKKIDTYFVYPEMFGIKRGKDKEVCQPRNVKEGAKIVMNILSNRDKTSRRDISLLNAAALIYIGGKSKDLKDAFEIAKNSLEEGKALEVLKRVREYSYEKF